jgi:hypothetical protein
MDDHAYCPHCRGLLLEHAPHPFPERPVRCDGCRLLVGPGRSRDANGRRRTATTRVSTPAGAARADAVLTVLQDLQGQTSDAHLAGVGGELLGLGPVPARPTPDGVLTER